MTETLVQLPQISSSSENHEYFDKIQEKIEELLDINKDLYESKKKNGILQETLKNERINYSTKEQEYENKINEFQSEIAQNQKSIEYMKNKLQDLQKENSSLKEDLKLKNEEKQRIENEKNAEITKNVELQTKELKNCLQKAENEILELKSKLSKAKESNLTNSELVNQKQLEIDQLNDDQIQLETLTQNQSKYIQNANEKLISYKSIIKESKGIIIALQKKLQESQDLNLQTQNELDSYKHKYEKCKEKISDLQCKVKALLPQGDGFASIDMVLSNFNRQREQLTNLKKNSIEQQTQLEKCQKLIEEEKQQLRKRDEDIANLQENLERTKNENENLLLNSKMISKKLTQAHNKNLIGKLLEKANKELSTQLNNIYSILHSNDGCITFRSLIYSIIIMKRLRKVNTSSQTFEFIEQNWWWMKISNKHFNDLKDDVLALINTKQSAIESEKTNKQKTNSLLVETSKSLKDAEEEITNLLEQSDEKDKIIHEMQQTIDEQEKLINQTVTPKEYKHLMKKMKKDQAKISFYEALVQSKEELIKEQREKLKKAENELNCKTLLCKQKENALQNARCAIVQEMEGSAKLEQEMKAKTKDILSLERQINNQKRANHSAQAQIDSLSIENKRFYTLIRKEQEPPTKLN